MSNYILGDLISRLKVASKGHFKTIKVLNTKFSIQLLHIFYVHGLINGYRVIGLNQIIVILKYYQNKPIFFDVKLISTPGKKVYWTLEQLSYKFNLKRFNGFYIISTSKGLKTSNDCILGNQISGKILLKIII